MNTALYQPAPEPKSSPLLVADRLLSVARDAERAGLPATATRIVKLAMAVCDHKPKRLS